jgi:PAS domain S-box-containing protein
MRRIENTVEDGERFFRELADNAPVMIWRSGRDKLCDWFNKPWLDFVGRTMEQELGNGWTENVHVDDFDRCLDSYVTSFDARERFTVTYRLRRFDGAYRYILDNGAPFYRAGVFAGYFGSCIDVTDQQETEKQLRQALKMEAVGQLTGGVAHDFNNLLTVIIGGLENIERCVSNFAELPDMDRIRRSQQMATRAARRAATLTSRLLAFSRGQPLDPKPLDANRLIGAMADFLKSTLGEQIGIETAASAGLWYAQADPAELESAIVNLAVNARDAMPNGGKLTIETTNTWLDKDYVSKIAEPVTPGQYVLIAVTDTGIGMDQATIDRVFEPFFTTKEAGKGTGLGLSQVYGFVRQSGGHIHIYSELARGTCVKIYLPRADLRYEEEDERREVGSAGLLTGKEAILVVEDDDDLRAYSTGIVRDLGYRVLEASNAKKALTILQEDPEIQLLFTDVVLPEGMSGRELAENARRLFPAIRILYTTGYTRNAIVHNGRLDAGVHLLSKPFTAESLAKKIRALLDQA